MSKAPHVSPYSSAEERALMDVMEAEDFTPKSVLSDELRARYEDAARNTLHEGTEKVSIRIARSDLARVKANALREGLPYQTYLKSLIHKSLRQSGSS